MKVILIILATLVVAAIVGLCIYLNTPVSNAEYGVTMSLSDVSSTGLTLHLKKEDYGKNRVWATRMYEIQEWTAFGWKRSASNFWFLEAESSDEIRDFRPGEAFAMELEWEKTRGRLPSGLYRVSKELDEATLYAPFFIINWWQLMWSIVKVVLIVILIWAECRYGLWDMGKQFVIARKRKVPIWLGVLVVTGIAGFVVWLYVPMKDVKLGIDLQAKESSASGVTLKLVRDARDSEWKVSLSDLYTFERWMPDGWEKVDIPVLSGGYGSDVIPQEYTKIWTMDWEAYCGKQPSGLYRITKRVEARKGAETLERKYHAPFLIVNPWEVITVFGIVLLLVIMIYLQRRFCLLSKIWKRILRLKKRDIAIFAVVLLVAYSVWMLLNLFSTKLSSVKYRYEVTVEEANSEEVTGTVFYDGGEKGTFLKQKHYCYLEKWSVIGWVKVKTYYQQVSLDRASVRKGGTVNCRLNYGEENELSDGTYRIKQPFELWNKQEGTTGTGEVYIEFEVK